MKKSLFGRAAASLSALALVIGMLLPLFIGSGTLMAADDPYEKFPLYIGGVRVTKENYDNVLKDDPVNDGKVRAEYKNGDAYWVYFDDAVITKGYEISNDGDPFTAALYSQQGVVIIQGTAEISGCHTGILGDIVDIREKDTVINIKDVSVGICSESVVMMEGVLNIDCSMTGIDNTMGMGTMIHRDAKVKICQKSDGPNTRFGYGIKSSWPSFRDGASVECISDYCGIYSGSLIHCQDCEIIAQGTEYGILAKNHIEVKGDCSIVAEGKTAIGSSEEGKLQEDLIIKEPEGGKLSAEGVVDKDGKIATRVVINNREMVHVPSVPASLRSDGNLEYYILKDTDRWFWDELGSREIYDHSEVIIPKICFKLPDVVGMKADIAESKIQKFIDDNLLRAKIVIKETANSDTSLNNIVKSTSPAPDGLINYDTETVVLTVYKEAKDNPPTPTTAAPTTTTAPRPTVAAPTATSAPKPTVTSPTVTITNAPRPTVAAPTATSAVTKTPKVSVTPAPTGAEPTTSPDKTSRAQILEFVERIYKYVLNREPEEEGALFWTDELYSFRRTGAEVGLNFIFSDEFVNRNLSDEDFVTVLYNTFFGREPEEGGFAFWTGALKDGTMDRMAVANGFVYSQEWADTCAGYGIRSGGDIKPGFEIEPTDATYAFVERMYTTAMKRASDESGKIFWANELSNFRFTGEQVGVMFFLSDEMNGFGLDNEEFVTRLYKTFMDRDPEEGGYKFWVGYLNDGGSREGAVLGFTRSEEFVNKCIEARILPY